MNNQRILTILLLSCIAASVCLLSFSASADIDDEREDAQRKQVLGGYLAGSAALLTTAAILRGTRRPVRNSFIASNAYLLASTGIVYGVGESAGYNSSYAWTLGGGVTPPMILGAFGSLIRGRRGFVRGWRLGMLLTPITATIAYHRHKKENAETPAAPILLLRMTF